MNTLYREIIRVVFFSLLLLSLILIPITKGTAIVIGIIYLIIDELILRNIFNDNKKKKRSD
jgi:hypothetical protein